MAADGAPAGARERAERPKHAAWCVAEGCEFAWTARSKLTVRQAAADHRAAAEHSVETAPIGEVPDEVQL